MTANALVNTIQNVFVSTPSNQWQGLEVDQTIDDLIFENAARRYYLILTGGTGGHGDIEIPMKSFQTRLRFAAPSYLAVVVPDPDQAAQIVNRQDGDLVVEMSYWFKGQDNYRTQIARAVLESIRVDTGGVNKSITLSGYGDNTTPPASVTLSEAYIYRNESGGKIRLRYPEPNVFLRPGDTARVGAERSPLEKSSVTSTDKAQ